MPLDDDYMPKRACGNERVRCFMQRALLMCFFRLEAALARLDQKLSPADQRIIVKATRTPHEVKWPEWWSARP